MNAETLAARFLPLMQHPLAQWGKRNIALILTLAAFISAIATYIVITHHNTSLGMKPQRVLRLLFINTALLALLILVIGTRVWKLWSALREGSGSRLQKRILILFSLVAITPTIIVSVFSALFFNLGIQTWFNDRVQTAVGESLAVAEAYLTEHKENIRGDALAMANDLNRQAGLAFSSPAQFEELVVTQSAVRLLTESMVFKSNHIIAQGKLSYSLTFERMSQDLLDRADKGEVVLMTNDDEDKVRALVKLDSIPGAYLIVGRLVDSKVIDHMENAQGAVNEYNTLKTQLNKLQTRFSIVFITLALLLLLAAIWYGMIFAARLINPITALALAAERVRGGDFSARIVTPRGHDEITTLSRAFNRMTEQLDAQRTDLIEANRRIDERRRFTEVVLSGVSAGVIALNSEKGITLFNRSASAIFGNIDRTISTEDSIGELLPGISELLAQAEHLPGDVTQSTLTIINNGKSITLHVRVTVEQFGTTIEGFIVTFDDITLLVSAQRNAAWADVARRVAHEIKNPLTPIQLAAERLKRKYLKSVEPEEQETFTKYTDTIAKHVGDIGRMVEEFVSFARMPTPVFGNEDLSALLRKAVFSAQVTCPGIDYTLIMPEQPVTLYCDERQITQVMTNLLKNAAEAIEARAPELTDRGQIDVKLSCKPESIELSVSDNGIGFPKEEISKMLEPYVTTRSKGTGLGLSIVKKIIEDHKGKITLENNSVCGAKVTLSFLQHCDINAAT